METQRAANKWQVLLLSGMIIAGIVLTGILYLSQPMNGRIHPIDGRLDLRDWNPGRLLSLNGEWDFYWQKLLTYRDLKLNQAPDLEARVYGVWNDYRIGGKKLPGFGYATYRLQVVNAPRGITLALRIPTISTSYRLYIDNKLVSANGKVGINREQSEPQSLPKIVEFTPDKTSFELIIQVANFTHARGGIWYPMALGTSERIWAGYRKIAVRDFLLIGALAVMAFYYLVIFLLRPADKSSLYFVLLCLMFISRTGVFGDYILNRLAPAMSYQVTTAVACITLCWFPVIVLLFVAQLFPAETPSKALKAVLVYGGMMTAIFLFTPASFYTSLINLVRTAAIVTGFYVIICLTKAFLNHKNDALLVLIWSLAVFISAGRIMLAQNNIIQSSYGQIAQLCLLILLLMQSLVLARRFATTFHDVEALSEKLLKLDKIKDEFLANTSHELRTPLSGILGVTEATLRGSEGELTGGQKQNLSIIAASSRRMANLINDILDYSKLKHGDIRLNIKPVKLDGMISTVVKVFQQLTKAKEYEIIYEIPAGLPPALADENRVVQILYNLLGNAVKFTTRGYIKVEVKVIGKMLEVCVSDTGEGIPGDKLEDIFKSFEQLDTSLTRKHGGTGLGLSITKQLVELQGGKIRAESTPGAGSAFYFTLPAASVLAGENANEYPAEDESSMALPAPAYALELVAASFEEQPVTLEKAGTSTRVLLVDDDAVNLQSLGAILKIGGYAVITANSGKAALEELAGRCEYSLVVLDVMMPEMSGYEVCQKIRESKSHFDLPVLMLTAKTATADIVTGFEAGANDYLPKPFEPEELLARVKTLVNLKTSVDKAITTEVAFMQAQIKPHYLYNTLNTISSFCDTDPGQARQLIEEFANYLRQSFDFKNLEMFVPITNEIGLIKSYVEIEKARFGANLQVEFAIDENLDVQIPPLSIQPLVENAIHHGIRKKGGSGTVRVTVKNRDEGLLVSVADDGSGIPPEKLTKILQDDVSQGIGLWNINFRLRKLFGKSLIIESEPGKGTRVMFTIPREVSG
ncbi:MAG TPA: ATP-binding protein [Bacillota bacterium]